MCTPECEQSQSTLNHKIQQYANSTTNVGIFISDILGSWGLDLGTGLVLALVLLELPGVTGVEPIGEISTVSASLSANPSGLQILQVSLHSAAGSWEMQHHQ